MKIVVIERTGRYHRPIQRTFAKAGFEVRIIHPLTTKQHRQPANPGNKTDDTDLAAMQRAAVNGFGLLEPPADPSRSVSNCWRGTGVTWSRRALRCAARSTNIFMRLCQDIASVLKTSMMPADSAVDRPTVWLSHGYPPSWPAGSDRPAPTR